MHGLLSRTCRVLRRALEGFKDLSCLGCRLKSGPTAVEAISSGRLEGTGARPKSLQAWLGKTAGRIECGFEDVAVVKTSDGPFALLSRGVREGLAVNDLVERVVADVVGVAVFDIIKGRHVLIRSRTQRSVVLSLAQQYSVHDHRYHFLLESYGVCTPSRDS